MELKLDGYLTKEQYLFGTKLFTRKKPSGSNSIILDLWIFLMAVGVCGVIAGIAVLLSHRRDVGILFMIIGGIFIKLAFDLKKVPEKSWKSIEGIHITGFVSDEGITLITANGQNNYQWDDLSGFGVQKDIALLVPKKSNIAHIIPKQFFENEQAWQTFTELVSEQLPLTYTLKPKKLTDLNLRQVLMILVAIAIMVFCSLPYLFPR